MKKLILILILFICSFSYGQFAFPDAVGAGASSTGGRAGKVCHVNTLTWNAAGAAVYDATTDTYSGSFYDLFYSLDIPAKHIVFDISGIIQVPAYTVLDFNTLTNKGNITVSGQTAPGKVVFETDYFQIENISNLIWRYCSFYNIGTVAPGADVLWVSSATGNTSQNIIIDHCSFYYGGDECLSIASSSGQGVMTNVTVQNCLMAASSKGSIIGSYAGDSYATTAYNCYVDISYRFPNMLGYNSSQQDAYNNFCENVGSRLIRVTGDGAFNVQNMYIQGQRATYGRQNLQWQTGETTQLHSSGLYWQNVKDTPTTPDFDLWQIFAGSSLPEYDPIPESVKVNSPMTLTGRASTIYLASQLKDSILPNIGNLHRLDASGNVVNDSYVLDDYYMDLAINEQVTATQKRYPTTQFPTVSSGTAYTDTDKDGMPDTWETANSLNPNNNDSALYTLDVNYTNLEMFVNEVDRDVTPPVSDTEDPTTPTGLASSNITPTGFTIDWIESTDDTGVVSYTVLINTVPVSTVTGGTTYNASELSAETNYDVTIIANDAAGNSSTPSDFLAVTTTASTPVQSGSGRSNRFKLITIF